MSRRNVQSQTSTMISSLFRASYAPLRSLIASTASNDAITATAGPSTPAVSQVGVMPGGGLSSIRQRMHGVLPGQDRHRLPFAADHAAEDPGLAQLHGRVVDQVAGLEVVGAVEDQVGVATRSRMFVWSMSVTTGSIVDLAVDHAGACARPPRPWAGCRRRLASSKRIWRWRLWVSMKSRSTMRT